MKMWQILFLLTIASISSSAQSKIVADITNFESNKGICKACLFNTAASFNGEGGQPFRCVQTSISNRNVQAIFENIPEGTYALMVLHDANSNNKMDKNFLGIPKEGYGASKNKLPFAAAPTFNENKFTVGNNNTVRLQIRLRNL